MLNNFFPLRKGIWSLSIRNFFPSFFAFRKGIKSFLRRIGFPDKNDFFCSVQLLLAYLQTIQINLMKNKIERGQIFKNIIILSLILSLIQDQDCQIHQDLDKSLIPSFLFPKGHDWKSAPFNKSTFICIFIMNLSKTSDRKWFLWCDIGLWW